MCWWLTRRNEASHHKASVSDLFPRNSRRSDHQPSLSYHWRAQTIAIRAPPLSGKSKLCDLLRDHLAKTKSEVLVARVLATRKPSSVSFSEYFKSIYNCELDKFWDFTCNRVLVIDDAHLTYDDEYLWLGLLKNTYERRLRGPRIVLCSSSGGDRQVCIEKDFTIDRRDTFGLSRSDTKLGFQLSRLELDEMIGGSIFAQVGDLIWHLSSAHIGIAHGILSFLTEEFQNKPPESIKASEMELVLRSASLLDYIHKEIRGIPTAQAFELLIQQQNISSGSREQIMSLMYRLKWGEVILSPKEAIKSDVVAAIEWLKRSEFLYEDENTQLQFASNMHLKMWLHSTRHEPYPGREDFARDDYFVKCIKRMNASKLQRYTTANTCNATQEHQIQLELYRCTVDMLPRDDLVTPERRIDDGTGFTDLVIRGLSFFWIWELVVNEDDEVDISSRFETRGKGFEGYTGSFQYVLLDFRQNKRGRHEKDGCLYVSFEESYEKALISGLGGAIMTVDLYKYR